MAASDPYLTVAEFKNRIDVAVSIQDESLASVLKSASRQVDGYCGRTFGRTEGDEARYFTWNRNYPYIEVDDLVSVTAIATDYGSREYGTSIAAEDFALRRNPQFPVDVVYSEIEVFSPASLPSGRDCVRVTGIWGWPAPPDVVREVVFLLANRQKSLWTAPFGVAGTPELGTMENSNALSPIFREMLNPYRVLAI